MVYFVCVAIEIEENIPNVVHENLPEKKRRLDMVHKTFGSDVLPTLEKVEYKVCLNFSIQSSSI